MKSFWKNAAEPVVFFLALLVLWEILVEVIKVPVFILPPPRDLWTSFLNKLPILGNHSVITFIEAFGGFALSLLLGVGFAISVVYSRHLQNTIYPLIVILYAMPKSAFAPLMVIWVGYGLYSKIAIAFLVAFFPIVVNVATGLATIEPETEDVLRALGARKMDIMLKVGIPRSMPYFFGSLKIAITLAFVGTVISESVASNYGLGNLMLQAQAQFQVPLIFAGLVALAVEGIVMYWLMAMLETRMTGWAQRSGFAQA